MRYQSFNMSNDYYQICLCNLFNNKFAAASIYGNSEWSPIKSHKTNLKESQRDKSNCIFLIAKDLRRERDKPAPKLNYRRHAAQLPQQISAAHSSKLVMAKHMTSNYKTK